MVILVRVVSSFAVVRTLQPPTIHSDRPQFLSIASRVLFTIPIFLSEHFLNKYRIFLYIRSKLRKIVYKITMLRVRNSVFVSLSTKNLQLFDPGGKYFQLQRMLYELKYYFPYSYLFKKEKNVIRTNSSQNLYLDLLKEVIA